MTTFRNNLRSLFTGRKQQSKTAEALKSRPTPPATVTRTPATTTPYRPPVKSTYQINRDKHMAMVNDGTNWLRSKYADFDIGRLIDILHLNRCAGSPGEALLIHRYFKEFDRDGYGNFYFEIKQKDGSDPSTMFTAHTDTVSHDKNATYHPLCYNRQRDVLFRNNGEVLGADDGTGIWLLLNMIDAKVPGLYCFFRDEETGGQGSGWAFRNMVDGDRFTCIDRVISFDRKGTTDVISTQRGQTCCSTTFGDALAKALNAAGPKDKNGKEIFMFKGGATGSFTDSASFMREMPECTNISVGYDKQHTEQEIQEVTFALRLRGALTRVDWEALPTHRDPSYVPPSSYATGYGGYGGYSGYGRTGLYDGTGNSGRYAGSSTPAIRSSTPAANTSTKLTPPSDDVLYEATLIRNTTDLETLICDFPEIVADLLTELGMDAKMLQDRIIDTYAIEEDDDEEAMEEAFAESINRATAAAVGTDKDFNAKVAAIERAEAKARYAAASTSDDDNEADVQAQIDAYMARRDKMTH